MDNLGKLDSVSSISMAVTFAALVAGWIVTSADSGADAARRIAREDAFTLTQDGRLQVTVTAPRAPSVSPT